MLIEFFITIIILISVSLCVNLFSNNQLQLTNNLMSVSLKKSLLKKKLRNWTVTMLSSLMSILLLMINNITTSSQGGSVNTTQLLLNTLLCFKNYAKVSLKIFLSLNNCSSANSFLFELLQVYLKYR